MMVLVTLEIVEGLAAIQAFVQRLAGRRAELAGELGVHRTAVRASDLRLLDRVA
jgi:hypothetical protein